MKNRGFTLVELLAVIVILAIILAIAIPSITNVVNSSRLSSFAVSSKMLERAAKTYLSVNNTAVASGSTSYILYSDMKTAGYINKVVDPQSNTECTHSGVYVTNNSGTYAYKGALACDNYMDIDAYNLITNSDFSNGTTGWGIYASSLSVSSQILSVTGNGTDSDAVTIQNTVTPVNITHQYYTRLRLKVTNNVSTIISLQYDGTIAGTNKTVRAQSTPVQNQWYSWSCINTLPSDASGNVKTLVHHTYADAATANGKVMQVDGTVGVYTIDLTSIYGAGNEPTVTQMDNIMNNMGK